MDYVQIKNQTIQLLNEQNDFKSFIEKISNEN